jgi:transposase-like protein
MQCPDCKSERRTLLESRKTARGVRRRRYECQTCLHRWTDFEKGHKPKAKPAAETVKHHAFRRLSREEAIEIIQSKLPQRELSKIYGITRQAISRIQTGQQYKDIYEELFPFCRRPILHCIECLHWLREGCGLEFPEAGDTFATDCSAYKASVIQLPTITDDRQSA